MHTEINGHSFEIGQLSVRNQFHVARRLAPVLAVIFSNGAITPETVMSSLSDVATSIADMRDADADYVMDACLSVVKFIDPSSNNAKFPIQVGKQFRYDWIDLPLAMKLVGEVIKNNLSSFMSAVPSNSPE